MDSDQKTAPEDAGPDTLPVTGDLATLLQALVDIESVSGNEARIVAAIQAVLEAQPHLEVTRVGNTLVARTDLGRAERVVIAGHVDTVPVAQNLPSELVQGPGGSIILGRGSCDMKGGVAVALRAAVELTEPVRDITWIFYDCEEVEAARNGLNVVAAERPDLLEADLAILMEPTGAAIEGGCQGSCRFDITTRGVAAHSGRSWLGHNAIHDLAEVLERITAFDAGEVVVDTLTYREGMNATAISGGIASNVIPDRAVVHVNYRFAPDKSPEQAERLVRDHFAGLELEFVDMSPAARPGLDLPAARAFVEAVGGTPRAKYGWTDVARFSQLGIPAVNYGPADPGKAHADDEQCPVADLERCHQGLTRWLAPAMADTNDQGATHD